MIYKALVFNFFRLIFFFVQNPCSYAQLYFMYQVLCDAYIVQYQYRGEQKVYFYFTHYRLSFLFVIVCDTLFLFLGGSIIKTVANLVL